MVINDKSDLSQIEAKGEVDLTIKYDHNGLPLVPQPSKFADDPLNFPKWRKWLILIQVSILTLFAPFNTSLVNPALVVIAGEFGISTVEASWQTTLPILMVGLAPLFWTPLSNKYGIRPILLFTNLAGIFFTVGTGATTSWAAVLVLRALSGICICFAFSAGAAICCDMFFMSERAVTLGVYAWCINNGVCENFVISLLTLFRRILDQLSEAT